MKYFFVLFLWGCDNDYSTISQQCLNPCKYHGGTDFVKSRIFEDVPFILCWCSDNNWKYIQR